jgi:alkanesulfonate monooxygenase SsuD/methylene tetrahydromethanopterin reductase-like flavin-dependent oxidoreductase (luciferase family)
MKFNFGLPHMTRLKASLQAWETKVTGPDQLSMARQAERLGYDMIAVPEHFTVPESCLDLPRIINCCFKSSFSVMKERPPPGLASWPGCLVADIAGK